MFFGKYSLIGRSINFYGVEVQSATVRVQQPARLSVVLMERVQDSILNKYFYLVCSITSAVFLYVLLVYIRGMVGRHIIESGLI